MTEIARRQEELNADEARELWAAFGEPAVKPRWVALDYNGDEVTVTDLPEPPPHLVDVIEVDGSAIAVMSTPSGILIGFDLAAGPPR